MRQIYPAGHSAVPGDDGGNVDLAIAYAYPAAGLWVRANMIASADGAAAVGGVSRGLSGESDHELFGLLRSLADVILVGAETARAEGYGPARIRRRWAGQRTGRPPSPPIAVVTRSLDLDLSGPLLAAAPAHARTIVITTQTSPPERRAQAARFADVVIAGHDLVDLSAAITSLAARGLGRVLTEGGPRLLGQLAAAGLLDDLCLTVSPLLAGGDAGRITACAGIASPQRLRLAHVLEADGSLFCRYLRHAARQVPVSPARSGS